MSRALAALLAEAQLADRDLGIARAQADRDAQNFTTASSALQGLVPAASRLADVYGKSADDDAALAAKKLLAENATNEGERAEGPADASGKVPYAETPEQMAQRLVSKSTALQAPQKTGNVVQDFINDPLGIKARAAAKAQVAAEQGLVTGIDTSRDKAKADQRQAAQDAFASQNAADESALRQKQGTLADAQIAAAHQTAQRGVIDTLVTAARQNGVKPDALKAQLASDPRFSSLGIQPEMVDQVWSDQIRAEGDKDETRNANKARLDEEVRHNKAQEGIEYARMQAMKDAAASKSAGKSQGDTTPLVTELKIANDIRTRAKSVGGAGAMAQSVADDYAKNNHGLLPSLIGAASNASKGEDRAKLETDIADFVEHSVNALEQTKRSVSKEQKDLIKKDLIGAIGTPTFDAKMAEVQRLLQGELNDRLGVADDSPSASTGMVGTPTAVPTYKPRANPF
jgi:hypothetical protein